MCPAKQAGRAAKISDLNCRSHLSIDVGSAHTRQGLPSLDPALGGILGEGMSLLHMPVSASPGLGEV